MVVVQSAQQSGIGAGGTASFNTTVPPGTLGPATGNGTYPPCLMTIQATTPGGSSCLVGDCFVGSSGINCNIQNVGSAASPSYVVTFVVFDNGGQAVGI